jgi:hypothetical protein
MAKKSRKSTKSKDLAPRGKKAGRVRGGNGAPQTPAERQASAPTPAKTSYTPVSAARG